MTSEERLQAEQMRALAKAMSFDVAAFRRIKELLNPSDAPPEARAHVEEIGAKICNLLDGVRLKAQNAAAKGEEARTARWRAISREEAKRRYTVAGARMSTRRE